MILQPGNYKLSFSLTNYESKTVDVTVTASEIAYTKAFLKNINIIVPDYPAPEQGDGATALNQYDFVPDGNVENPDLAKQFVNQTHTSTQRKTIRSDQ